MRIYALGFFVCFIFASRDARASCFEKLKQQILVADIVRLQERLSEYSEEGWHKVLKEFGISLPENPHVLERWGSDANKLAYKNYLLKQALSQRIAKHFEGESQKFLDSELGRELLNDPHTAQLIKENMPQILLALAASDEVSSTRQLVCTDYCMTNLGREAYRQLNHAVRLESFNADHEKVRAWVYAIQELMQTRPDLWQALQTKVRVGAQLQDIHNFFSQRGFPDYAKKFKYSGWFIQPELVSLRSDNQSALGTDIRNLFQAENSMCCGTKCGNCPLGYPSILKEAQKKLEYENTLRTLEFTKILKEADTVYHLEREVILSSVSETYRVMNELSPQSFGIYSGQGPTWIDGHFRDGVLEAEMIFLSKHIELVRRHYQHNADVRSVLSAFLRQPLLLNNREAKNLLFELEGLPEQR